MSAARAIGIWISGLFASLIVGGAIGGMVSHYNGPFLGALAGPAVFTCLRLWLGERTRAR